METLRIPVSTKAIASTTSKGDQSKWKIGEKWIKQDTRGYESVAEFATSLILESSTLKSSQYVSYTPCLIEEANGEVRQGCYSMDLRGKKQEVTLERLFEANFTITDTILNNQLYSTEDKFKAIIKEIQSFTGLDVAFDLSLETLNSNIY